MQRVSREIRQEFIGTLIEHTPHDWEQYRDLLTLGRRLLRHGATYGRLQEAYCNRKLRRWEEKKEGRIETLLKEACEQWGITPIFQGDPRGNTPKLKMPDGYTDDWGHTGFCVPTS